MLGISRRRKLGIRWTSVRLRRQRSSAGVSVGRRRNLKRACDNDTGAPQFTEAVACGMVSMPSEGIYRS